MGLMCESTQAAWSGAVVPCRLLRGHDGDHKGKGHGYRNLTWQDRDLRLIAKCKHCGYNIEWNDDTWWIEGTCKNICSEKWDQDHEPTPIPTPTGWGGMKDRNGRRMCGCEAHWNERAFCKCSCPDHEHVVKYKTPKTPAPASVQKGRTKSAAARTVFGD